MQYSFGPVYVKTFIKREFCLEILWFKIVNIYYLVKTKSFGCFFFNLIQIFEKKYVGRLPDYKCDACESVGCTKSRLSISEPPPVLIIQLNRFTYDMWVFFISITSVVSQRYYNYSSFHLACWLILCLWCISQKYFNFQDGEEEKSAISTSIPKNFGSWWCALRQLCCYDSRGTQCW